MIDVFEKGTIGHSAQIPPNMNACVIHSIQIDGLDNAGGANTHLIIGTGKGNASHMDGISVPIFRFH
jgi:hypothetical protein